MTQNVMLSNVPMKLTC